MTQPALAESSYTASLNMALNSTGPERSVEAYHRKQIVRFGKWLYRLGFVPGTAGNLSVRLGPDCILATPTGMSKYLLRASDMVLVDLDGRQIGGSRNVTSEIGMHLVVYRQRPDVQAVVHAHPPVATGFASCGLALEEPLCSEVVMALGSIPLAPYATTGTAEVAASIEALILHRDAVLLANHGVVTAGDTLHKAFMRMETVEHYAQISLVARQLGCAKPLSSERLEQLSAARASYQQNAL